MIQCLATRLWSVTAGLLFFAAGFLALAAMPANREGRNFAFLVGVEEYDKTELKPALFAVNDIVEFRQVLVDSGFKENRIVMLNEKQPRRFTPEGQKIRGELKLLLDGLEEDDTIVVALAGHGIQFEGDKDNYFCPIDAKLDDKKTLISLKEIYDQLEGSAAGRKLLLVDACRNDPQSQLGRATRPSVKLNSVTRPQTEPVPEGIVAVFSCRAGQQSFGDPDLKHGIFFHHVLEGWRGKAADKFGRVTLDRLVTFVKDETQTYARENLKASQTPTLVTKFGGVWVLADRSKPPDLSKVPSGAVGKISSNSIGMKLVTIPAGEFMMGSGEPASAIVSAFKKYESGLKAESFDDEFPQHRVRITKPFQMGIHEVTVGQFRQFVQADNYKTEAERDGKGGWGNDASTGKFEQKTQYSWQNTGWPQGDDHPVVNVTWNDAEAFCAWLSRKDSRTYRLPTEAVWEYACRAGTKTRWYNGDDPERLVEVANVADGTAKEKFSTWTWTINTRDGYAFTAPVGKFKPNAFGLHDMHGNVWEWCSDLFDAKYYEKRVEQDPPGPSSNSDTRRVLRGGSWDFNPRYTRSTYRNGFTPVNRSNNVGFRVVCVSLP